MIDYRFYKEGTLIVSFEVDPKRKYQRKEIQPSDAEWTHLEYRKCKNCPLSKEDYPHCPAAIDVKDIADHFSNIISFERVTVEVVTDIRVFRKECDVQTALRSLNGLVMATSACPILGRLRFMAQFHLPFANVEETLFRTASAYLLQQYFQYQRSGQADWDLVGLRRIYQDLETVNQSFKKRIESASEADANMNAIGSLFYLGTAITISIDEQLAELEEILHV
jgi:hypothetical protein